MLVQQIGSHGLFDLDIEAEGDTWIDDHHTNEDLGTLDVHLFHCVLSFKLNMLIAKLLQHLVTAV